MEQQRVSLDRVGSSSPSREGRAAAQEMKGRCNTNPSATWKTPTTSDTALSSTCPTPPGFHFLCSPRFIDTHHRYPSINGRAVYRTNLDERDSICHPSSPQTPCPWSPETGAHMQALMSVGQWLSCRGKAAPRATMKWQLAGSQQKVTPMGYAFGPKHKTKQLRKWESALMVAWPGCWCSVAEGWFLPAAVRTEPQRQAATQNKRTERSARAPFQCPTSGCCDFVPVAGVFACPCLRVVAFLWRSAGPLHCRVRAEPQRQAVPRNTRTERVCSVPSALCFASSCARMM